MATRPYPSFTAGLPLTRHALDFAALQHDRQRREADAAAFILHPLEVAHLLHAHDYPDRVVAAAVLHDVLEDTPADYDELEAAFGAEVAKLVCAVTEPSGEGGYAERKARLRAAVADAGVDALAVFAADKVAKARELRLGLVRHGQTVAIDPDKLAHYRASLELLERRLDDHGLVRQLRFELEALAMYPPGVSDAKAGERAGSASAAS